MKSLLLSVTAAIALIAAPINKGDAAPISVDVELQMLVDVSGSVDSNEFNLQRDGYVSAFRSASIQNAILNTSNGRLGKIAAELIYWSSASQQIAAVGWTLLDSAAAINTFADDIANYARPFSGGTRVDSAINFGYQRFALNDYDGKSQVMDVSGDGTSGAAATEAARDAALAAGIDRINGLPIGGGAVVENFYANSVVGGSGSFLIAAATFGDFSNAIQKKLALEISGEPSPVPLPAGVWLLGTALGGIGAMRRRKKREA